MNRELLVQLDWLVIHQWKSDITNLIFMHNLTSVTRQGQNTYGQVWGSIQIFCPENVERSFANLKTHWSETGARSCHYSLVHVNTYYAHLLRCLSSWFSRTVKYSRLLVIMISQISYLFIWFFFRDSQSFSLWKIYHSTEMSVSCISLIELVHLHFQTLFFF